MSTSFLPSLESSGVMTDVGGMRIKSIKNYNSSGDTLKTKYTYITDLPVNQIDVNSVERTMLDSNIIVYPLSVLNYVKDGSGTETLISGQRYT